MAVAEHDIDLTLHEEQREPLRLRSPDADGPCRLRCAWCGRSFEVASLTGPVDEALKGFLRGYVAAHENSCDGVDRTPGIDDGVH